MEISDDDDGDQKQSSEWNSQSMELLLYFNIVHIGIFIKCYGEFNGATKKR